MKSIFLAHSFHDSDKDIVESIEKVIGAFGIELKTGRRLGGEVPESEIEKRIESSDALIALFTKREGGWPTSAWVLNEYGHAVSIRKWAIAIVEKTVIDDWLGTMRNARERIELDRGDFGPAILMLVEQIGTWRKIG